MYRIFLFPVFPAAGSVCRHNNLYRFSAPPPLILPMMSGWFCWMHRSSFRPAFFGTLPADADKAEAVVRARMQSPEWQMMQAELAAHYRDVAHALVAGREEISCRGV